MSREHIFGSVFTISHWPMPQRVKVKHGRRWHPNMGWRFQYGWVVMNKDGVTGTLMRFKRVKRFHSKAAG